MASAEVAGSPKLRRILEVVLRVGNFLNGGTARGGLYGCEYVCVCARGGLYGCVWVCV